MCCSCGYKSMPYMLGLISIIEMLLGIIRIVIFFSQKTSDPNNVFSYDPINSNDLITSPLLLNAQTKAAFAIDWITSIVPTLMGVYVTCFSIVAVCSICVMCCAGMCADQRTRESVAACSNCCKCLCLICTNKANHRCVSLNWNCPCYKARPKLRFQVRFGLLVTFIFLRIIAIILYVSAQNVGYLGKYMAAICSMSIIFLVLTMLIDFYQYRVWWYYRPDGAYKRCRCCCCKQHFHASHQRFLPIPLLGIWREQNKIGNRPCQYTVSGTCSNLSLEHIVIFHAFDFKPLRRYQLGSDRTYIGFHQTTSENAASISQTGFRRSMTPPQMLGFGVYFARSFADTIGKARTAGMKNCSLYLIFMRVYIYISFYRRVYLCRSEYGSRSSCR